MSELPAVLIVEDNPRNLKLVRDVLTHAGYRTLEATTAEAGLALVRRLAHADDGRQEKDQDIVGRELAPPVTPLDPPSD